jgi:hypothetical protein
LRLAARPEAPSGPKACRKRLERNFRQKPIDAGCIQAEYAMASVSPSVPEALLMRPLPALILSLQFGRFADAAQHRTALPRHRVRRWLRHALLDDVQVAEITVRIVGTEEAQSLNRDYRQRDYATNVLTFDYSAAPHVCADLLLCADVVAQEAADQGKPLKIITPICWCMAPCMRRAWTTRPVMPTRMRWRPKRHAFLPSWVLPTRTPKEEAGRLLSAGRSPVLVARTGPHREEKM